MSDIILESISDGVFTVDGAWRISSFNRAAERITGMRREDALGRRCHEVFKSNMCESECPLRRTMRTGKPIIDKSGYCVDAEGNRIPISVSTALLRDAEGNTLGGAETFRDLRELEALKEKLEARDSGDAWAGRSPAMRRIADLLPAIAESGSTVLIGGETGTGKEVTARAIHRMSGRAAGPFVALNCAALPDSLLESELFGYKKGAFTGAAADKPGRFALAEDGTLFLDEIGDISPALQVKLLRVLQEREYEALGSAKTVRTNARIICATNKDLAALVAEGRFRKDLFYRVNVVSITLPPLRERQEDIPRLAEHLLRVHRTAARRRVTGFSPDFFAALYAYPWPGNIRELENVVERALALCRGSEIGADLLPQEIFPGKAAAPPEGSGRRDDPGALRSLRAEAERARILEALEASGFRCSTAAHALGIDKATIYRKMKAYGIVRPR